MYFQSVVYTIYMQMMSNLHTHVKCFVWGCKLFGFRGEGRRYGVKVNHMITLESLESSFFYIYFTSYFIYLARFIINAMKLKMIVQEIYKFSLRKKSKIPEDTRNFFIRKYIFKEQFLLSFNLNFVLFECSNGLGQGILV